MVKRDFPWWLVLLAGLAAIAIIVAAASPDNRVIFSAVAKGLVVTIEVSLIAYGTSVLLGLLIGLLRACPFKPFRELATFYIEVVRGLPMLVILYYIAFVGVPALTPALGVQDITQLGKVYSASTFKFFETYNVVAFFYLLITISLSLAVRSLEKKLKRSVHP